MDRSAIRVLLLDDEPFILKLHAHMLSDAGFVSILSFEDGALALEAIERSEPPDLILLDLSMPRMDGIEFMRHLVQRGFTGRLILVSGEDERLLQSAERLVRAHGLHTLGHLSKPVKPAVLRSLIEDWERRTGLYARATEKAYSAEEVLNAIRSGQLVNHYQPKISVVTGEFQGAECLSRWQHPDDGLVLPGGFIGVAEGHGLIDELTRVSLARALSDIKELELSGLFLRVAVNLSTSTLASVDFANFAAKEAARASVSSQNVVFEVTESQLIRDFRAPLEVLTRLRLMRFGLSIDDFGTGYSSLAQLRDIPFDELKIDQTFVHRAPKDKTARAIYDASLDLAKKLGLKAVAEGVEDRADWDLVRSTGCDEAQGFLIGRPMPKEALPAWVEGWRHRSTEEFGFS